MRREPLGLDSLEPRSRLKATAKARWLSLLGVCVAVLGCGDSDEDGSLDCANVRYELCDILEDECQRRIFRQMRCLRGDTDGDVRQPNVSVVDTETLRDQFNAAQEEQETLPDVASIYRAFELLGLVTLEDTEEDVQTNLLLEGLLGFYTHDTKEIVIVDSEQPLDSALANTTLGHEYVHALQDQEFDIGRYQDQLSVSVDTMLSVRSLVEGEAAFYDGLQLNELIDLQFSVEDWIAFYEDTTDQADQLNIELSSPLLAAALFFPYSYGAHSTAVVFAEDGQAGIRRARDSELAMQRYLARRHGGSLAEPPDPTAVLVAELPGLRTLGADSLGAWMLQSFLQQALGEGVSPTTALAWRNDAVTFFVDDSTDHVAVVWRLEWKASSDAATFTQRVNDAVPPASGTWLALNDGATSTLVATSEPDADLTELVDALEQQPNSDGSDGMLQNRESPMARIVRSLRNQGCLHGRSPHRRSAHRRSRSQHSPSKPGTD